MRVIGLSNLLVVSFSSAFHLSRNDHYPLSQRLSRVAVGAKEEDRRSFLSSVVATTGAIVAGGLSSSSMLQPADAVGPIKLALDPKSYKAAPCPPSKPIPGEKAMFGMRGLCVTVQADLLESPPKDLEKVGVYGFVVDGDTGNSVLANNPDLSTDAGQFAMIESITTKDKKVEFEFIAAVPTSKDLSQYDNGIGPLQFDSLRVISFPGGQQFGAINPCEMNEFSDECEAWEAENGPYSKGEFMVGDINSGHQ
jgi:hypothetical protein